MPRYKNSFADWLINIALLSNSSQDDPYLYQGFPIHSGIVVDVGVVVVLMGKVSNEIYFNLLKR